MLTKHVVIHSFARILLRVDVVKWRETPRALLLVDHQAKVQQSVEFHGRTLSMHGRRGHPGTGNRRDADGIHPRNTESHIPVWFFNYINFILNLLVILKKCIFSFFFFKKGGLKQLYFITKNTTSLVWLYTHQAKAKFCLFPFYDNIFFIWKKSHIWNSQWPLTTIWKKKMDAFFNNEHKVALDNRKHKIIW